jgi:hypothetical protein
VKKTFIYGAFLPILFLTASCSRQGRAGDGYYGQGGFLPDLNILFDDYDRVDSTGNYAGFASRLVKANRDLQSPELYMEAASLYEQAGNTDSVVLLLHRAIDYGMANPYILSRFSSGTGKNGTDAYKALQIRLDSIRTRLQSVSNFSLELDAMDAFWPYYEAALQDTSKARQLFHAYVFNGPRQLRDYYAVRYLSIDAMYGQMINASPNYYRFLRKQFDAKSMLALRDKTARWMERFKALYPQAVFPKVYVVPGLLNSGGTATEMGLFVGGDMYGKSENTPTAELTEWQRDAIMEMSSLPSLTLHELMHFQQNYRDPDNMNNVLFNLVQEGVCDLLVEICSGEPLRNSNLEYLENPHNRERILKELSDELYSDDISKWLYNGGSIQDRPHDLGYTLGYLITKSYYERQPDKRQAIYELLNSSDLNTIVNESEYAFLLHGPL